MNLEIHNSSTALGLHNCGDLSDYLISFFLNKPEFTHLLNFGCCYHKITYHQLSTQARFLATRSYKVVTEDDLLTREHFKSYRYTLELFLTEEAGLETLPPLKSSPSRTYQLDFSRYAQVQLKKLLLKPVASSLLSRYYNDKKIQKRVQRLINLGHIRGFFGRTLEKLIVLERAQKIEMQGHKVHIFQGFDPKISPRNLAIHVEKRSLT